MANRERGEVSLKVGADVYTLVLTINAQCEIEEKLSTGEKPVLWQDFLRRLSKNSMRDIRLFFWAALREYHHELDEKAVGALLPRRMDDLAKLMASVLTATEPDPDDVKAAGISQDRPLKAQTNAAPYGDRSISMPAVSA